LVVAVKIDGQLITSDLATYLKSNQNDQFDFSNIQPETMISFEVQL